MERIDRLRCTLQLYLYPVTKYLYKSQESSLLLSFFSPRVTRISNNLITFSHLLVPTIEDGYSQTQRDSLRYYFLLSWSEHDVLCPKYFNLLLEKLKCFLHIQSAVLFIFPPPSITRSLRGKCFIRSFVL